MTGLIDCSTDVSPSVRLRALAEEVRQSDRGQDADDQNDDEELDQSETGLLGLNKIGRASCRERVYLSVSAGALKKKGTEGVVGSECRDNEEDRELTGSA